MLMPASQIISKSIELYRDNSKLFLQYVIALFIPASATTVLSLLLTFFAQTSQNGSDVPLNMSLGIVYFIVAIVATAASFWVSLAFIKTIANKYNKKKTDDIKTELLNSTKYIIHKRNTVDPTFMCKLDTDKMFKLFDMTM